MSYFNNIAPRTTRGILLSTVSALALTAACDGPTGPGGGGTHAAQTRGLDTMGPVPANGLQKDQSTATSPEKPPKVHKHTESSKRFVGHPSTIQGWTAIYFEPQEFASKGNGQIDIDAQLVDRLDSARADFGFPIRITSGYRDPGHNKRVGGAKNSRHMHGDAVDIDLTGYDDNTRYRLLKILVKHGFTSFGSYSNTPSMLHADIRERAAKWHHGHGSHPTWFSKALSDAGWKRGATADEMANFDSSHADNLRAPSNASATNSVTIAATKLVGGPINISGLLEVADYNGWKIGANAGYDFGLDTYSLGGSATYEKDNLSVSFSGTRDINENTELKGELTYRF